MGYAETRDDSTISIVSSRTAGDALPGVGGFVFLRVGNAPLVVGNVFRRRVATMPTANGSSYRDYD